MPEPISKTTDSSTRKSLNAIPLAPQSQAFTRAPLLTEIPDQGQVIALVSGTLYIYTKYKNARYRAAFTAAP